MSAPLLKLTARPLTVAPTKWIWQPLNGGCVTAELNCQPLNSELATAEWICQPLNGGCVTAELNCQPLNSELATAESKRQSLNSECAAAECSFTRHHFAQSL